MANYIDNGALVDEIRRARELGYITRDLTKMMMTIVDHYITHPKWNKYTYKDDMKSNAYLALSNAALKFDPDKSSFAFTYYTKVIHNAFIQVLKYEKKHRTVRDVLLVANGMDPSYAYQEEMDESLQETIKNMNEPADEFNESVDVDVDNDDFFEFD